MLKKVGQKLFQLYCHPDYQEDILGDLEEHYEYNFEVEGKRTADRKYLVDVLMLFRLSLLRETWISQKLIQTTMVKNNFKMAYRSMMRHKFYSFLNLSGLAISMAACVFIAIYVQDELSYDKHVPNYDRIYRVAAHIKYADNLFNIPAAPDPMAKTLLQDFPEVEMAGRTHMNRTDLLQIGEKFFRQQGITFADQAFLDIMKFPVIRGDREHLLDEPNTTVIEESVAKKLFGDMDPIGQIIKYNNQVDLKVSGVIKDIPDNTHFDYDMFITNLNNSDADQNIWLSNNFITYVKLNEANDKDLFESKMPEFLERHVGPQVQAMMNVSLSDAIASGGLELDYYLQPLSDIHLYSELDFELGETGTITYVYMFSIIGLFILIIACINFMNMATARATVRAKEVGVRKVLGSLRKQLISQFLTESLLNAFIAILVAVGIVYLLLPAFNQLTDKNLSDPIFGQASLAAYLLLGTILIGILAGIYPAFILSSFKPVKVIKGELSQGRGTKWLRSSLVVFQFFTSIALIISSAVIYTQLDYLQSKDLGFNKDQILMVNETQLLGDQIEAFKNELKRNPLVENASISGFVPALGTNSDFPFLREDATSPDDGVSLQMWRVDHDYASTYDLEIIDGRYFDKEFPSDSAGVILNETALRRFGYLENPVGKKIKTLGGVVNNQSQTFTIVGVMKDFYFKSLTESIQPHALLLAPSNGVVNVKFNKEATSEIVGVVGDIWDEFAEGKPFDYNFLNQALSSTFRDQNKVKTIFSVFAVLAITIACLGLFGLASYITEQRKKEIGIRKVLGATNMTLLNLLFSNFTKLLLISAVLAIPVAWWYIDGWLSSYPVRIAISPLFFIFAIIGVLIISWMTVGFQSFKAVQRNPVDNLRSE